jgi:dihydroneopterin aldolase
MRSITIVGTEKRTENSIHHRTLKTRVPGKGSGSAYKLVEHLVDEIAFRLREENYVDKTLRIRLRDMPKRGHHC